MQTCGDNKNVFITVNFMVNEEVSQSEYVLLLTDKKINNLLFVT